MKARVCFAGLAGGQPWCQTTYDGAALIGHSTDGLKLRMMRENPMVCVEVDHMDDLANCLYRILLFEKTGRFERR